MRIFVGILIAAALVAAGCATPQPIQNIESAPIILPPDKRATMNQVATAIMRAGTRLGWQMQPEGPGRIAGRLNVRTHLAVIDIQHDLKTYSIKYRDSSNLDARDGTIHRFYNNWVLNLDKAIRNELAQL